MGDTDHSTLMRPCDEADARFALWARIGMLPVVRADGSQPWASICQYERVLELTAAEFHWGIGPQLPDELFAPPVLMALGQSACLTEGATAAQSSAEALWMQLLPLWAEAARGDDRVEVAPRWHELDVNGYRLYSLDPTFALQVHRARQRHQRLMASRSGMFARSANYMGSKAALAGQLLDLVDALEPPGTTLVDLMCGSGAMAGAFARHYPTVASDAQEFSRLLGLVQGGGMTRLRATTVAEQVVQGARSLYETLPDEQRRRIEREDRVLNSELTPIAREDVLADLKERAVVWDREQLGSSEAVSASWKAGALVSHLYAGLYFGERQAAELDCLRRAVAKLTDVEDRQWALGALVCAASSCAYTYGGHFAQPKLDIAPDGKRRGDLDEALQQRSLSVTHEFFVRLTSLAEESERVESAVELVAGPWEAAVEAVASRKASRPVCVYVDPPYTRDEYSRYYHVLEAIVRYQPQAVSGKGRLPKRGGDGRFASALSGRRADLVEREIANVLHACLKNGWNCLWSYSNSGTASVGGTLAKLDGAAGEVDIFQMAHSYKAQGRRGAKQVLEYAVHLRPSS